MAKKTTRRRGTKESGDPSSSSSTSGSPAFPYATTPHSLRRFFELVPKKPRPVKVNSDTLKAWGLRNSNDTSIIRVLKALGLVTPSNEPTELYTEFMSPGKGPTVLAAAARSVWAPIFEHSHEPHKDGDTELRNYFHIYSGGSERAIQYQIQSFKAVCDHADFSAQSTSPQTPASSQASTGPQSTNQSGTGAAIHIDLHIHLPENKSRRDYEYIFEDIARYIFGRDMGGGGDDRA